MIDGETNLIVSAVKGEASAFGRLYDYYQPKIYRFVLVRVGMREEAEDLTHQVFLHAWQNIASYSDLGFPFSSWLYRIARNQLIDHYRTRKNLVALEEVDVDQNVQLVSSESATDRKLEFERILKEIQKLKPEYQEVIMMRFVEERSLKEVAFALEKSEGAIKLIQHRALKQLKELIA